MTHKTMMSQGLATMKDRLARLLYVAAKKLDPDVDMVYTDSDYDDAIEASELMSTAEAEELVKGYELTRRSNRP